MPGASSAAATDFACGVVGAEARLSSAPPVGMRRASTWSTEVEDAFRIQMAGYRDLQAATPTHPCHSPPPTPPTSAAPAAHLRPPV